MTFDNVVTKFGFWQAVILFWQARRLPKNFWQGLTFKQAGEIYRNVADDEAPALRSRAIKTLEATAQTIFELQEVFNCLLERNNKSRRKVVLEKMFAVAEGPETNKFRILESMHEFCFRRKLKKEGGKCLEKMRQCAHEYDDWKKLLRIATINKDEILKVMALSRLFGLVRKTYDLKLSGSNRRYWLGDGHGYGVADGVETWGELYRLVAEHPRLRQNIKRRFGVFASQLVREARAKDELIRLLTFCRDGYGILGSLLRSRVCRKIVKFCNSFEELDSFISGGVPLSGRHGPYWSPPHVWKNEDAGPLLKKMLRVAHSLKHCLLLGTLLVNDEVKMVKSERAKLIRKLESRISHLAHTFDEWQEVASGPHLSHRLRRQANKQLVTIIKREVTV